MDDKNLEFQKKLQATFKVEAEEHARAIAAGVFKLGTELSPGTQAEVIEVLLREAHSLKGAARVVSLSEIEALCQAFESVLAALKRREAELSRGLLELFTRASDAISRLTSSAGTASRSEDILRDKQLKKELEGALKGNPDLPPAPPPPNTPGPAAPLSLREEVSPSSAATVRIPVSRLDAMLAQAEEISQIKPLLTQRLADLGLVNQTLSQLKKELAKGGKGSHLTEQQQQDLHENREVLLNTVLRQLGAAASSLGKDQHLVGRMADEQLEAVKAALMLPASSLLAGFPKFVRDLALTQGKKADLALSGGELEVDKRILEELKDPLIHLLRNAVDHGIKNPEERLLQKKPAGGTIKISFGTRDGRQMEVLVSDDGSGMDADRVRKSAVKAGLITKEKADQLSTEDALALAFKSGVSTSPMITDLSGRGLGLAIVREKAEKLGGSVSFQTGPDGTTFRFLLPLTLTAFRGVPVKAGGQLFIFPANNFKRALRLKQGEIKTVENRETIQYDGRVLPIVKLGDALGVREGSAAAASAGNAQAAYLPAVIIASEGAELAFLVEEVLGQQQFLVKGLGRQLARVLNISGAAVTGTGGIVPVLDVQDLLKSAIRAAESSSAAPKSSEEGAVRTKKILVADDSITSRTLIKNILETAGYQVTTAVDGEDAFTQARAGGFDLVVSDVDMPRLNGFELTEKIRADRKLAGLPVVLVTALESRADQERGIDAGATAYIMKSSFDQSNLLDVVSKLI